MSNMSEDISTDPDLAVDEIDDRESTSGEAELQSRAFEIASTSSTGTG